METMLPFLGFWGSVLVLYLFRKSLAPLFRWRNLLILIAIGVLNFWLFSKDPDFHWEVLNTLNAWFPGKPYPFWDCMSTQIVTAIREEVIFKGMLLFLLLLLLKLFNPGINLKWGAFLGALYVSNLYSVYEAEGYIGQNSGLFRCLTPLHFSLQVLTGYVLYRYAQWHRWYHWPLLFVVAVGLTIVLHWFSNSTTYLPTEVTIYMSTNPHYSLIYIASMVLYFMVPVFSVHFFAIWLGVSVWLEQEGVGKRWCRVKTWFQKYDNRVKKWLPITAIALTGLYISLVLYPYERQPVKPAIISYYFKKRSNNEETCLYFRTQQGKDIKADSLPIVRYMQQHKMKRYYLFNPFVGHQYSLGNGYVNRTYVTSLREYIFYNGFVVAISDHKHFISIND